MCRDDRIRKEGNRGKGVGNSATCVICILGYYRGFEERAQQSSLVDLKKYSESCNHDLF